MSPQFWARAVWQAAAAAPSSHRSVYLIPTALEPREALVAKLDAIISDRLDRKGIVHTGTNTRARGILGRSRYAAHMIADVGRYRYAKAPAILLTPTNPYDWPGETCRYQILIGRPASVDDLVADIGHAVRKPDDWCETFLVSDEARAFVAQHRPFVPAWFLESVQRRVALPKPPKVTG